MTTEIGHAAALHLEHALDALKTGDMARAVGALAAIDEVSWRAIADRFGSWAPLTDRLPCVADAVTARRAAVGALGQAPGSSIALGPAARRDEDLALPGTW